MAKFDDICFLIQQAAPTQSIALSGPQIVEVVYDKAATQAQITAAKNVINNFVWTGLSQSEQDLALLQSALTMTQAQVQANAQPIFYALIRRCIGRT